MSTDEELTSSHVENNELELNSLKEKFDQELAAKIQVLQNQIQEIEKDHQASIEERDQIFFEKAAQLETHIAELEKAHEERVQELITSHEKLLQETNLKYKEEKEKMEVEIENQKTNFKQTILDLENQLKVSNEKGNSELYSIEQEAILMKNEYESTIEKIVYNFKEIIRENEEIYNKNLNDTIEKFEIILELKTSSFEKEIQETRDISIKEVQNTVQQYETLIASLYQENANVFQKLSNGQNTISNEVEELTRELKSRNDELQYARENLSATVEHMNEAVKENKWIKSRFAAKNKTIEELTIQLNLHKARLEHIKKSRSGFKRQFREKQLGDSDKDEFWRKKMAEVEKNYNTLNEKYEKLLEERTNLRKNNINLKKDFDSLSLDSKSRTHQLEEDLKKITIQYKEALEARIQAENKAKNYYRLNRQMSTNLRFLELKVENQFQMKEKMYHLLDNPDQEIEDIHSARPSLQNSSIPKLDISGINQSQSQSRTIPKSARPLFKQNEKKSLGINSARPVVDHSKKRLFSMDMKSSNKAAVPPKKATATSATASTTSASNSHTTLKTESKTKVTTQKKREPESARVKSNDKLKIKDTTAKVKGKIINSSKSQNPIINKEPALSNNNTEAPNEDQKNVSPQLNVTNETNETNDTNVTNGTINHSKKNEETLDDSENESNYSSSESTISDGSSKDFENNTNEPLTIVSSQD